MKKIAALLNNLSPLVATTLSIVLTILVGGAVGYFLIWPSINTLSATNNERTQAEANLAEINRTISFLENQNQQSLATEKAFMESLVPDQVNIIHFASLNEIVSAAAGVTVKNIQLSQGVKNVTTTAGTAPAATGQTSQLAGNSATVTYSSNFDSLLRLIQYWQFADQQVGVSKVEINSDTGGDLNYTMTYDLPTTSGNVTATINDRVTLTQTQKDAIDKLKQSIHYMATPSANPVGKDNPFQ